MSLPRMLISNKVLAFEKACKEITERLLALCQKPLLILIE